jgi:anti-repressor protein
MNKDVQITSMKGLTIAKGGGFNVRIIEVDGNPYFCLPDLCRMLQIKNNRNVVYRLNPGGVRKMDSTDTLGRKQQFTYVSESNMYKVIFQSTKPVAEEFTEWVTGVVLPEIRRKGAYTPEDILAKTLQDPHYIMGILQGYADMKETNKKLEETAEIVDQFLLSDSGVPMGVFAKTIGIGRNKLFALLRDLGILDKHRIPYQQQMQAGRFVVREKTGENGHVYPYTIVTTKGQTYLLKLLKKEGWVK